MRSALLILALAATVSSAENLIRNGSFEGSLQYWPESGTLVEGEGAPHGGWCMRLDGDQGLRSMPFALVPGRRVTIACWAKAGQAGEIGINPSPSNREVGQATHWAWNGEHTWRAPVGTGWTRVAVSFEVPVLDGTGGFVGSDHTWWNGRSWNFILGGPKPLWIDGLTVAYDDAGADGYLPYAPVEVTATAIDLPGYRSPSANLLDPTIPVTLRGAAFNPGATAIDALLRFEQLDYRGERNLAPAIDKPVRIAAGATAIVDLPLTLAGRGLVQARVSVVVGGETVSSSVQPLTALAFPKHATVPDPRERFGASVFGPRMTGPAQAIGLGWTRWYPQMNWAEAQPTSGDVFTWEAMDAACAILWGRGIGAIAVLHAIPEWAKGGADPHLPKDMQWAADDPRWDDASVVTSWDLWVAALAAHYRGKAVRYEFANEPDISGWDVAVHARMATRTARALKRVDPDAGLLLNVTWPGVSAWTRDTARLGGFAECVGHTFHNYTPGELCDADSLRDLQRLLRSFGAEGRELWFDEGWIFTPSSLDYPSPELIDQSAPAVADLTARTAANLLAAGLDRFIPFFIGYEQHGRSWWDWVGSGTEWWDDLGNPTVAVGVYNLLCHHLGRSHPVRTIHAEGAVLHVFHDERNDVGVAVAWASGADVRLPLAVAGARVFDVMGNPLTLPAKVLALAGAGRPHWLVAAKGMNGERLAAALAPLAITPAATTAMHPPEGWSGDKPGTSAGNPALVDGVAQWRVDQIWPDDPLVAAHHRPLVWNGSEWIAEQDSFGGQPAVDTAKTAVRLSCRAVWSGAPGEKLAALSFIAPRAGRYRLRVKPAVALWEGRGASVEIRLIRLPESGDGDQVAALTVKDGEVGELDSGPLDLAAGARLTLVPRFPGWHIAGTIELRDLGVERE